MTKKDLAAQTVAALKKFTPTLYARLHTKIR